MKPLRAVAGGIALALMTYVTASTLSSSNCGGEPFVAEVVNKHNRVERDHGDAQNVWSAAKQGERLEMGDALRTGSQAQATLRLPQRGRLLVKSDTIVRFMPKTVQGEPEHQFDVLQGELTVETGAQPLGVRTKRGLIRLDRATKVHVHAQRGTTRFDVDVGRVEYTLDGQRHVAEAGHGFELQVLEVSVEESAQRASRSQGAPDAATPTAPVDAGPADAGRSPATTDDETFQKSPATALLTLTAGESVTIHDPAPPTDIAVKVSQCPQEASLEIWQTRSSSSELRFRGAVEVRARVPHGSYRYRARCLREGRPYGPTVGRGLLRVVVDAATRPLPLAPVTVTADADGRRYTISYQNRPPTITFRWPYAPHADNYHLVVRPARGAQFSLDSAKPTVTLAPGRLGEGLHRFWFETRDHKRSETGVLHVSFDFTARTGYLTSPRDGAELHDHSAHFAGGTLLGSRVQVQGLPTRLDAHGRFSTTITLPPEVEGAAVRVEHPSAGLHYYVRHLKR